MSAKQGHGNRKQKGFPFSPGDPSSPPKGFRPPEKTPYPSDCPDTRCGVWQVGESQPGRELDGVKLSFTEVPHRAKSGPKEHSVSQPMSPGFIIVAPGTNDITSFIKRARLETSKSSRFSCSHGRENQVYCPFNSILFSHPHPGINSSLLESKGPSPIPSGIKCELLES